MKYKCYLCNSKQVNDIELGEFMHLEEISVHYFCLLLGSGICQSGEDDEGILGFLRDDIEKEVKRISKQQCCYCKKLQANLSCCDKSCFKHFHLPCAVEGKFLNCFVDTFQSFCGKHHNIKITKKHESTETCTICYENMGEYHPVSSVQSPCCYSGWFHKKCLMTFAKTAGYFFKCPLCNNNKEFRDSLPQRGIFIPDKDASWELEPNAFQELLERPKLCEVCNEKDTGRSKNSNLILCELCGSYAAHRKCWETPTHVCSICIKIQNPNCLNPDNIDESRATNNELELSHTVEMPVARPRGRARERKCREYASDKASTDNESVSNIIDSSSDNLSSIKVSMNRKIKRILDSSDSDDVSFEFSCQKPSKKMRILYDSDSEYSVEAKSNSSDKENSNITDTYIMKNTVNSDSEEIINNPVTSHSCEDMNAVLLPTSSNNTKSSNDKIKCHKPSSTYDVKKSQMIMANFLNITPPDNLSTRTSVNKSFILKAKTTRKPKSSLHKVDKEQSSSLKQMSIQNWFKK